MDLMMASAHQPEARKLWTQQVMLDPRTQFAVLKLSHRIKILHSAVILIDPESNKITNVACIGDGIQIGQLV